jgi:hypothetical protein
MQDVKDLNEISSGFEKKRTKIADAEIRNVASRRKAEL